jgi:hypothetical protein
MLTIENEDPGRQPDCIVLGAVAAQVVEVDHQQQSGEAVDLGVARASWMAALG